MNESRGLDLRRAWRLVGAFAPVTILVTVPVALLSVASPQWMLWVACAVLPAAVAVAGWAVTRGERSLVRAGGGVAGLAISALVAVLVFWGLEPVVSLLTDGAQAVVWYALMGAPWLVLVVCGTLAARAGRYPGAARVTIWWILSLGAAGLALPVFALMGSLGIGDDLSMLVLFFIPPVAMCMWLGPAALVGGVALARRREAPAATLAEPLLEVSAR
jgi:hypothetical protein